MPAGFWQVAGKLRDKLQNRVRLEEHHEQKNRQ
jgi:hypothetical protein